jgi:hypothetical protein
MSNEQDRRNNEITKKTNDRPQEPFNKQNPNEPVEVAEKNLENVQDNQKAAAQGNIRNLKPGQPRTSAQKQQRQKTRVKARQNQRRDALFSFSSIISH